MGKSLTLEAFFKKKEDRTSVTSSSSPAPTSTISSQNVSQSPSPSPSPSPSLTPTLTPTPTRMSCDVPSSHNRPSKIPRLEAHVCDINSLERDPGLRLQILDYPLERRNEIRCAYLRLGPYQPKLKDYPSDGNKKHPRSFNYSWFNAFQWLEYSPAKDAAFCLPCFVFSTKANDNRFGSKAFIVDGFRAWRKVNAGDECAFLSHIGKSPKSAHNIAVQACQDLMRHSQHIDKVLEKQSSEQIAKTRLRVQASVDIVRWLAAQACAFRGHDEHPESSNRGNFLELLKMLTMYNERVADTVLENAPKNASYTSPTIQKEILSVLATKVRKVIREEIGNAKFCIIVDEARDESKREQMAIVLRFVDKDGLLCERFLDVVHVSDTSAVTLKREISAVLSHHNLSVMNIRGQGYDGASNMRGEWNGLQALFLNDCPYAYYIHCFAHRLQLALVAAAKEVGHIYEFFTQLSCVVNAVGASCKRHDELLVAQANHLTQLLALGEVESGRGLNQIGTLQRPRDTRWSSHFTSVCSLIKMFDATCCVLTNVMKNGFTYSQRGDAHTAYKSITSFQFVFILHLMKEIMGITDQLCQMLQSQSQDILNALQMVKHTKVLLQELRDGGWSALLEKVTIFCSQNDMVVPDMNSLYVSGSSKRRQTKDVTIEHHFRYDIFTEAIDSQRAELNSRFNEHTMELFVFSSALSPKDGYRSFKIDDICELVEKFYPQDFTDQEKIHLRYQLQYYALDIPHHDELKNLTTLSELCEGLVKTGKSAFHPLVYRLICLVLTLPVSTATTERAFSAMKLVKSRLRNRMEDEFLSDSLVVYIEREIAGKFSTESLIEDFRSLHPRREQF